MSVYVCDTYTADMCELQPSTLTSPPAPTPAVLIHRNATILHSAPFWPRRRRYTLSTSSARRTACGSRRQRQGKRGTWGTARTAACGVACMEMATWLHVDSGAGGVDGAPAAFFQRSAAASDDAAAVGQQRAQHGVALQHGQQMRLELRRRALVRDVDRAAVSSLAPNSQSRSFPLASVHPPQPNDMMLPPRSPAVSEERLELGVCRSAALVVCVGMPSAAARHTCSPSRSLTQPRFPLPLRPSLRVWGAERISEPVTPTCAPRRPP